MRQLTPAGSCGQGVHAVLLTMASLPSRLVGELAPLERWQLRELAMRWRILGLSTLTTLCLLGSPSASAWDGGNRQMLAAPPPVFSPHVPRTFVPERFERMAAVPRRGHIAVDLRLHRHGLTQTGLAPLILGTGGIFTEAWGPPIEQQAPPEPQVIIIGSRGAAPEQTAPEPPPDYSYAGCHAIPSGYHCDLPSDGAAH